MKMVRILVETIKAYFQSAAGATGHRQEHGCHLNSFVHEELWNRRGQASVVSLKLTIDRYARILDVLSGAWRSR
jgi:hypothetical protein